MQDTFHYSSPLPQEQQTRKRSLKVKQEDYFNKTNNGESRIHTISTEHAVRKLLSGLKKQDIGNFKPFRVFILKFSLICGGEKHTIGFKNNMFFCS